MADMGILEETTVKKTCPMSAFERDLELCDEKGRRT